MHVLPCLAGQKVWLVSNTKNHISYPMRQFLSSNQVCSIIAKNMCNKMIVRLSTLQKDIEIGSHAKIPRLTRLIQEQESYLILAEPKLRFTISTKKGTQYCFLLPSDYERREWQESMQTLKTKCKPDILSLMSNYV